MKKYKYDISIVVPVYNAENYLGECVESVMSSNFDITKIEIILVNDGSTDNSLEICNNYKKKYSNIKVINQENKGVSHARNMGIKASYGKYILFLDSDDTISKRTLNYLDNFFESNYNEIEIITYPIFYNENNKFRKNTRYNIYDKTGIYDIKKHIFLNQSNVNIMIKNHFSETELYNERMKLSEDQEYDTRLIMKKEKIGFVKEAEYYYRKHDGSISYSRNNPYYCFEDIMSYNEYLLKKYRKNNKVPKYIQALVIGTIGWRIRTDELFPYYLEGKEYELAIDRIKKIVSSIDEDVIMGLSSINLYHKIYLFEFSNRKIDIKYNNKSFELYVKDKKVYDEKEVKININKFKIKNNKVYLMGDIFSIALLKYKPDVYIQKKYKNGKNEKVKIDLFLSNECMYDAYFKVTNVYGFDIDFDAKDLECFNIIIEISNKTVNSKISFNKFACGTFVRLKKCVIFKNQKFIIKKYNLKNILNIRLRALRRAIKNDKKSLVNRILYYLYPHHKNIWLYYDSGDAIDNGYRQFMHDVKLKDGIKRYYVTKNNKNLINNNFDKITKKKIVIQYSLKHKMLYLHCNKILTSFVDLQVYCPFNKDLNNYKDLLHYDLIYLQHGMLHSNLVKMYSKEYKEIDKFVISSKFEYKNLMSKYHYKDEDLLKTGMPRMGEDSIKIKPKKKILFAPSWRKYLIGSLNNNTRNLKTKEFQNSIFYKKIYNFLHSEELREFLIKNNFTLDFKLHPIFNGYKDLFDIKSGDIVTLNDEKTKINEYSIFITDFSSFQFDFVKLKRPIIYFLPDRVEFKCGLHSYKELDLKYEDAFGKLCLKEDELINELVKICKNDCKPETKYQKRMDEFFYDIKNPCDDIYNIVFKD